MAVFLLPNIFGEDENVAIPDDEGDVAGLELDTPEPIDPRDSDVMGQSVSGDVTLGNLTVTTDVDREGCPVDSVSMLNDPNEFHVVAPNSDIPEGTVVFARLYRDGEPIEDLNEIVADREYEDTCLSFTFETVDSRAFQAGDYEVEFFVNGNPYGPVELSIQ
jgi:hypothetical protein